MAEQVVLAATTAAGTWEFTVNQGAAVSLSADGLGVAEAVDIEIKKGSNWRDCYDPDGTQIQITATSDPVVIDAPGNYRLNKGVTASPVSLHAYT